MGPIDRPLRVVGDVNHAVDQVARWNEFRERHPEVSMQWPRPGSGEKFRASWDGAEVADTDLRLVLDELERQFNGD